MVETKFCVGGDGGPLVVLQATAVVYWQGALNFDNSLMNGGNVETDYDVICQSVGSKELCIIPRHGREMLVLWDSEFGGMLLPPESLSLPSDAIVLMQCYADDDLPSVLPKVRERIQRGPPERSLLFDVQDTMLRLQVGADSFQSFYGYNYLDISVLPGTRICDAYLIEHDDYSDTVAIVKVY